MRQTFLEELIYKQIHSSNKSGKLSKIHLGNPWPLGSTLTKKGVNFSIAAPTADGIQLLIFRNSDDKRPKEIFELDQTHRSGDYWHIEVEGLQEGTLYAYKVFDAKQKNRKRDFSAKVLLDPCARAISGWNAYKRATAIGNGSNVMSCLKGVVCERDEFDLIAHPRPRHRLNQSVIYELHVGGFTSCPNSSVGEKSKGTFIGLLKKLPYLKSLGITTIELMPIHAFDSSDAPQGVLNHWGYSPINWFTPHPNYVIGDDPLQARRQIRELIAACHDEGIEVLIDVVYNHTTEGNQDGPTISWKGFGEDFYYFQNKNGEYLDVSGCGNSIAANRPLVTQLILESLRCWATELGVDGFRFDLGVALSRGENLEPLNKPFLFEALEADPRLSDLKLLSEPWDCGGLYRLGDFPAKNIATWNGHFRDDLRRFWKGDNNTIWGVKERLLGSSDLYKESLNPLDHSLNFITSHDGFTLNDLVSFNEKHNLANGENNRDGENHNNSWNHGIEGPTSDRLITSLRNRQKRNLLSTLLLTPGIPMLLMGDEVGRSQGGNNNTWCQNNKLGWMIWEEAECDLNLLDFVKKLLILRAKFPALFSPSSPHPKSPTEGSNQIWVELHGVELSKPDFNEWSHTISYSLEKGSKGSIMWMGLNACDHPIHFQLPHPASPWNLILNTARQNNEPLLTKPTPWRKSGLEIESKSLVVMMAKEYSSSINFG